MGFNVSLNINPINIWKNPCLKPLQECVQITVYGKCIGIILPGKYLTPDMCEHVGYHYSKNINQLKLYTKHASSVKKYLFIVPELKEILVCFDEEQEVLWMKTN